MSHNVMSTCFFVRVSHSTSWNSRVGGKTPLLMGGLAKSHQSHVCSGEGRHGCAVLHAPRRRRIRISGIDPTDLWKTARPLPFPDHSASNGSTREDGKAGHLIFLLGWSGVLGGFCVLCGRVGLVLAGVGGVVGFGHRSSSFSCQGCCSCRSGAGATLPSGSCPEPGCSVPPC